MLNFIWCFFIIIAIVFSFLTGNIYELNNSIFSSIEGCITLVIKMFGNLCFWCGVINIISETSLKNKIMKAIDPLNRFLFPDLDKNSMAYENISVNIVSDMLGLRKCSYAKWDKSNRRIR